MKKPKRKNKPGAGRPNEGRVREQITILPETLSKIHAAMNEDDPSMNTKGKVIDEWAKRSES